MSNYTFRTIIEPEDEGGYHGFVPLLPGLHVQAENLEDVNTRLHEAILCHIQALQEDGEQVPQEEKVFEQIQVFSTAEFAVV